MLDKKDFETLTLLLLNPFLAFVSCCRNLRSWLSGFVFVFFFALFGFSHMFWDTRADSYRKFLYFKSFHIDNYYAIWRDYHSGIRKDLYEGFLYVFLKSWTDNPHIMMMTVGICGGCFYYFVLRRFVSDYFGEKNKYAFYVLIAFMVFASNIAIMGGIRNFVAFSVFAYSSIRFLIDKNNWWLIGLAVCPFIHFSFIVYVAAAIFVRFVHIPKNILFWATITACTASIFISSSAWSGIVSSVTEYDMNEAMASRIEHYADAKTEKHFSESLTTKIIRVQNKVGAVFVIIFLFYLRRNWKLIEIDEYTEYLYRLTLFWLFFGYSFITFSVVGQRYLPFGMIMMYFLMLNLHVREDEATTRVTSFIKAMPIVFAGNIAWLVYNCYCNTSLLLYCAPVPIILYMI